MKLLIRENPDRWHSIAWWLCVVTLPWLDMANNVSLIFLGLVWIIKDKPYLHARRLLDAYWAWPFIFYYFILVIGATYSMDKGNALFTLDKKITFLALPVIAATGRQLSEETISLLKRGFVYSCLTVVAVCLIGASINFASGGAINNFSEEAQNQFNASNPGSPLFWMNFSYIQLARWAGLHPGYLSMYLAFCLVILVTEKYSSTRERRIHFSIGAIISCFMALLSTRMAIAAFVVSVIYLSIKDMMHDNRNVVAPLLLFAFFMIATSWINPVSYFRVFDEPAKTTYHVDKTTAHWNSVNYRLLEWKGSWSIIESNWLAGVGTGAGTNAMIDFYARFNQSTVGLTHNAHNQYLQTWMESGIFGLIAFLLCLFGFLLLKIKMPASYLAFIIIFSLMCLTESIGERQKGVVFFTFFQTLFLGFEARPK